MTNNEYIKRTIDSELVAWKNDSERLVLLLRGARQVGKSSSVRNLGRTFEHFLEVNFEKSAKAHNLFSGDLNVKDICEELYAIFKVPIIPGKTLLFFDEIQSCPNAIRALRYFYEDYPELHVAAAGSLLEFALEELPSFGVGRITSIFMYPMSYKEFLCAHGFEALWEKVCAASPEKPLRDALHNTCVEYLKKFLIIGGMPAVVADYIKNQQLYNSQKKLSALINTLKSDFSKYKKRVPDLRIAVAFEAAVKQSDGIFNYSKVEGLNYRQVKECLRLLQDAGLIIPVVHSASNGSPLGGEVNFKKQKFLLPDTGIFQRLVGLDLSDIALANDISLVNKGAIAEQFVGLELLKSAPCDTHENLYFWSRDKARGNAEVDYVIYRNASVIPIEVKSGSRGQMQSMRVFLEEKKSNYGVRTSLENFAVYDNIKVYPLYAIGNVR